MEEVGLVARACSCACAILRVCVTFLCARECERVSVRARVCECVWVFKYRKIYKYRSEHEK